LNEDLKKFCDDQLKTGGQNYDLGDKNKTELQRINRQIGKNFD